MVAILDPVKIQQQAMMFSLCNYSAATATMPVS